MTITTADPTTTPTRAGSAATGEHSHDSDPDVVRVDERSGLSCWQCRCGAGSLGWYADPRNARAGFLAHVWGVPWPGASTAAAPRVPRSHRVVNGLVFAGLAGMALLVAVPPLAGLCTLLAVGGIVAMIRQFPARLRVHRARRAPGR